MERGVEALVWIVVIAQAGVKVDLRIEQELVRRFELLHEVLGALGTIQVVAHHDDEREGKPLVKGSQLFPDLVLRNLTGAVVSDHAEAHGVCLQRERQLLIRRDSQPAARDDGQRNKDSTDRSRHAFTAADRHVRSCSETNSGNRSACSINELI